MSREIKFRCWDGSPEKEDLPGVMIDHAYMMQSDYLKDALNGAYSIMQYTGLKDKNGKEIYEGDILKSVVNYNNDGEGIFLVCFHKGIFFAKRCYEDDGFDEDEGYSLENAEYYFKDDFITDTPPLNELIKEDEVINIIGNIYQNPELLTQ